MVKVKNNNNGCKNLLGPTSGHITKDRSTSFRIKYLFDWIWVNICMKWENNFGEKQNFQKRK